MTGYCTATVRPRLYFIDTATFDFPIVATGTEYEYEWWCYRRLTVKLSG